MKLGGLCLFLLAAGFAAAAPVSFPITLNPFAVNASVVWANIHAPTKGVDIGDEEISSVVVGFDPLSYAGVGGGVADMAHGVVGAQAHGFADGSGQVVVAGMIVNASFNPTPSTTLNTIHMHVVGSTSDHSNSGPNNSSSFQAILSGTSVNLSNNQLISLANLIVRGCDPVTACTAGAYAFPYDLLFSFNVSPAIHNFQFSFSMLASANGDDGVFGANTAQVSFDLAPGVTLDQSSGFLTTPGDVVLPGSAPEPAGLMLAGFGLSALIFLKAFARRTH